jgi:hypothetical protein
MHYSVYAGLGFAAIFGVVAPFIARRISPAIATWLLSMGSVISALSAVAALSLLAMTLIGQNPDVAAAGHWSIPALRRADPVELPVALAALAILSVGLGRVTWVSLRRGRSLVASHRINRDVSDTGSDIVVLPASASDAYAVPGRPGRIFVTRGMLRLLTTEECAVMLAHERSHLRHRHHWHRTVVIVASALNPLLTPLTRTQEWLTERWADEDAARGNDRAVVASALARAAGGSDRAWRRPSGALALTSYPVEQRIAAMLDDPPRRHLLRVTAAIAILTLSVCGTFDGVTDEASLFHSAIATPHVQLTHLGPSPHR